MLNVTGSGHMESVEFSVTPDGNWYMRFELVDESGNRWWCKTFVKEYDCFTSGSKVYITEATLRKTEKRGKTYSYLEVTGMHGVIDREHYRQKSALEAAHKVFA
jgi:hypothetical protein